MFIGLIVLLLHTSHARLNFYFDRLTIDELFGIRDFQLFFIDNDQIRSSALKSPLRISSKIDFLRFTWYDDRSSTDSKTLHYQYNSSTTDDQVLLPPMLTIDETGIVPRDVSTFTLFFPCLETKPANSSVAFRFYNSTATQHSSVMRIHFEKFCRKDMVNRSQLTDFSQSYRIEDYLRIQESRFGYFGSSTIGSILIYSIIIAFLVFILVFSTAMSLLCLYRMTTKRKPKSEGLIENAQQQHPTLPLTIDMTTFEDVSLYSCTQYDFFKSPDQILSSTTFADCVIDSNRLTLHETFLEGKYGRLIHCSLDDPSMTNQKQKTLAKTLHSMASSTQLNEMLHDCCLFATIKHSTINSPLGIVYREDFAPFPLVIYPFSNKGILKRFLIQNRTNPRERMLSTQELVYMAIHIAKGLHYLHRRKMLMKDIGTRNCLVMDDLTVKLTDYALSSDLFPQDYETLQTDQNEERRPWKFMALESISERRFSTASDVWSYGVLLWELMTRGLQPYADIAVDDLVTHLQNNHRLVQPNNCPDSLFKLMSICWITSIDQRPSMGSLLHPMMEFYSQLARFI